MVTYKHSPEIGGFQTFFRIIFIQGEGIKIPHTKSTEHPIADVLSSH